MRLVRLDAPIGAAGLKFCEEPMPALGPRDVLVKVRAASLNYRDVIITEGLYPGPLTPRAVPLSDGAGVVEAVGERVSRARPGDRVVCACQPDWVGGPYRRDVEANALGMTIDGALAEYLVVNESGVLQLPDHLDFTEGAALPCAAVSAWSALHLRTPLAPGQTVLVQGTGGVALFGLQIARMFGARVFAITSSEEKAGILRALGAERVVNYRETPDWDAAILDLTDGVGVDKTVEIGGEATINRSAAATRIGGEIGLVGFVTGFGGGLPPITIMARALQLGGISIGPRSSFEALLTAMRATLVRPVLDRIYAFDDVREAYQRLKSGSHVGKVVVSMPG